MTTLDSSAIRNLPRDWTYWFGWVLSGLVVVFMAFDGGTKLIPLGSAIDSMNGLGYPTETVRTLGLIILASTLIYAIPRTALLGAILLTGILGGAIAANLRVFTPLFSHMLFGAYLGLLVWGGLWLRDERLRAMLPFGR